MTLLPGKPALVAQVDARVTTVKMKSGTTANRGGVMNIELAVAPSAFDTVLRMEVVRPDGEMDDALSGNLVTKDGKCAAVLPIALNDPPGDWKIQVRDVVSHLTTSATFQVR